MKAVWRSKSARQLIGFAVLGILFVLASSGTAEAATITVNTLDDELNVDGDCSLREAIEAANADAAVDSCTAGNGDDTITVPAGTYTLSFGSELTISSNVSLIGAGATSTIIQAAPRPPQRLIAS